ncbi:hypothetical protein Hanom_Chr01g00057981 [Helianthus anomalus]
MFKINFLISKLGFTKIKFPPQSPSLSFHQFPPQISITFLFPSLRFPSQELINTTVHVSPSD